jgi:nucleotide-binding universal stress UspA family protein
MTNTKTACPMPGFEKLLLATDGSESVEPAIEEAIQIAKLCSSTLYALSVVEVNSEYQALAPKLVEAAETETKEHLQAVKTRADKEGVLCETIVHQGDRPYKFIVDEAVRTKADMIILGTHGRTGLKRLMMGSVTARVIGHAPYKVMVIPS